MVGKTVFILQNGKKLNSNQFIRYFENKVLRTIRDGGMLDNDTKFSIKPDKEGKYKLLLFILSRYPNSGKRKTFLSAECLDDAAVSIIEGLFKGKNVGLTPENKPFYFMLRKEIEIYARLRKIGLRQPDFSDVAQMLNALEQNHKEIKYSVVRAFLKIK